MSLNFNRRGELQENTAIVDNQLVFIEERKYSPSELKDIKKAEKVLDEIEESFNTLNAFELMDADIPPRDMFNYLKARYTLHNLGWTREEDLEP